MPPTPLRRPGRRRLPVLLVALVVAVAAAFTAAPAQAQQRRIVVVGDSVVLGAESQIVGAFRGAGWATTFDASVNRSTLGGAEAVRAHAGELTDTLVVNLGSNDAGNAQTYRQRVDAVMAAAGPTPRVYWLTIREVRPYYAPANQVLRDAAERYPNLDLIDWNAATAGSSGLTAGDGLHLTPAGASSMAFLIGSSVTAGAPPAAPTAPAAAPATTVPATTVAPPPAAPAPAPPATAAPEVVAPTTTLPVPTTSVAPSTTTTAPDRSAARVVVDDAGSGGGLLGWTLGLGLTAVVVVLALSGAWIAVWSLLRTRGSAEAAAVADGPVDGPVDDTAMDRSARSRLRAARIAASRAHHPTAALAAAPPGEAGPDGLAGEMSPSASSATVPQS